jgi:hypothetical protein
LCRACSYSAACGRAPAAARGSTAAASAGGGLARRRTGHTGPAARAAAMRAAWCAAAGVRRQRRRTWRWPRGAARRNALRRPAAADPRPETATTHREGKNTHAGEQAAGTSGRVPAAHQQLGDVRHQRGARARHAARAERGGATRRFHAAPAPLARRVAQRRGRGHRRGHCAARPRAPTRRRNSDCRRRTAWPARAPSRQTKTAFGGRR